MFFIVSMPLWIFLIILVIAESASKKVYITHIPIANSSCNYSQLVKNMHFQIRKPVVDNQSTCFLSFESILPDTIKYMEITIEALNRVGDRVSGTKPMYLKLTGPITTGQNSRNVDRSNWYLPAEWEYYKNNINTIAITDIKCTTMNDQVLLGGQ